MHDLERRVIGKVMRRLIPFLILCYFVAYLDRVNVSFAKLHMNQALGFSEAAFGLGAGLFFIAYFLFEVPSNIFLERVGARLWIARIMISWGIVSAAFAFIPSIAGATGISNEGVFYTLRLLLGACEAGFFPGIIFYLTLWFPVAYRARVISFFMLAIPISSIVGAPISGLLLNVTGWGLEGWQWLFILEALPSLLVGIGVLFYLTDFPRQAAARRNRLAGDRASNREKEQGEGRTSLPVSGPHRYPHFAVRSGIFLPECGELRSCLLPANHHQKLWRERHPDRIAGRAAFYLRRHRHGAARSALRPDHGAKRSRRRSAAYGRDRDRDVRACVQSHHRHGAALLCADRRFVGTGDVLAAAGELPDRSVGRCRDCGDQFAGQSVRVRRSLCDGLSKGSNWQLHGRAAPARRVRRHWRSRRREPAY